MCWSLNLFGIIEDLSFDYSALYILSDMCAGSLIIFGVIEDLSFNNSF